MFRGRIATFSNCTSRASFVFASSSSATSRFCSTMVPPPQHPAAAGNQTTPGGVVGQDEATVSRCPVAGPVPGMSCPMEDGLPVKMTPRQIHSQLGKSRLSGFVSSTAVVGYVLCGGTNPLMLTGIALGTYLQGCSANCTNQCMEIENDRMMKRTCKRPLVVGAITKKNALLLSLSEFSLGTAMLYACHPHAAAWGVINWGLYVGVYTPLKKVSTTNTWWGAIVGAIPPLMGGLAATGGAALTSPALYPAWLLGGIMFVWQIPHFMSLAFHCRRDYEQAGFKMLAFNHPTRASIYAVSLTVVMAAMTTIGPVMCGMPVEPWFYVPSIAANAAMLYKAVMFHQDPVKNCRSCFVFSYLYLAVILALFAVNHFQPVTRVVELVGGNTAVAENEIREKKKKVE